MHLAAWVGEAIAFPARKWWWIPLPALALEISYVVRVVDHSKSRLTGPTQSTGSPLLGPSSHHTLPPAGACGYCGPDGVTPDSFWPAEPDFPDDDSGSEGGSWEGSLDEEGEEEEEGGSVVSGISWGEADRMAAEAQQRQQQRWEAEAAQAAQAAALPAAHAALVEPGLQPAQAGAATEHQQRKRRCA